MRPALRNRSGQDLVRVCIFRQLHLSRSPVLGLGLLHPAPKLRRGAQDAVLEVCDKGRTHDGAVCVCDVGVGDDVADVDAAGEQRQGRGEQEKRDPVRHVKADDLVAQRKRRVVHDDAALRILLGLVFPARPEWAQHIPAPDAVLVRDPSGHGLEDVFWRVAVVGCLLRLEFFDECLILRVDFCKADLLVHSFRTFLLVRLSGTT